MTEYGSDIEKSWERVQSLCRKRQYSEAIEVANLLLSSEADSEEAEGFWMRGYISTMQKSYDEALAFDRQAHAKSPLDRGMTHSLLKSLIRCKKFSESIGVAERLIELDRDTEWQPFTDSARFCKAYALYKLGRLDEAEQEFALVEDEGNMWIDRHLTTKAKLLEEIARARDLKR